MKGAGGVGSGLLGLGTGLGVASGFGWFHGPAWMAFLALGVLLMFIDSEQAKGGSELGLRLSELGERVGDLEEKGPQELHERRAFEIAQTSNGNAIKALSLKVQELEKNPRDSVSAGALLDVAKRVTVLEAGESAAVKGLTERVVRVENRTQAKPR